MIKKLDTWLIEKTLQEAGKSERKRANYCFHSPNETLHRMINAGLCDTYVRPHKHENPDKLEIFLILKGTVAVVMFDDNGKITESIKLDENGDIKAVEIPPKTWHTFIILSKEAALYEIIEGKYDAKTHKQFALWSPKEENHKEVRKYLNGLKNKIEAL